MITDPLYWGAVALGILAWLGLSLKEASDQAGTRIWPVQYIRDNPYEVLIALVGGIAAGLWMAGEVESARMGFVAGIAGTGFLERMSRSTIRGRPK